MATVTSRLKGGQGFTYMGLNRSFDQNFTLNGMDTDIILIQIDGAANAFTASETIQTELKTVKAAKVLEVNDGTGNADAAILASPKSTGNGQLTVTNLDTAGVGKVVIIVAVGTRV